VSKQHDEEKARAKRQQWEEHNRAKTLAKQQQKGTHTVRQFQTARGTRDILPPDTALWNRVEQTAREIFSTYGFSEIRVPIFEPVELFARSIGEETDVVSKEMYKFEDFDTSEILDLLESRNAALAWADAPISPGQPGPLGFGAQAIFTPFSSLVGNVIRLGSEAFRDAKIPRTPENQRQLNDLRDGLSQFVSSLNSRGLAENRMAANSLKGLIGQLKLGETLCLRPEATASVCRAYIQHGMQSLPQPVKLHYLGPMFRRERPQKGRYRQFYQIGAEVLETVRPDPTRDAAQDVARDAAVDAEVIEMLIYFFERCGLRGAVLNINSIGHAADNCRRAYVELLRTSLRAVSKCLGEDSKRRIETNPLRVLDSKVEEEQSVIAALPRIADHLCDDCKVHYAELKRQLDLRDVKYCENWRLVRGLDYYMRTTFEITARGLGSQDAVCGGGRYDGLVELLGGPPTKGIGFAIGEDRLVLSLQENWLENQSTVDENLPSFSTVLQRPDVAIAGTDKDTWDRAVQLGTSLRKRGLSVFLPKTGTKLQRVFDAAQKLGIRVAIVIGGDELKRNDYVIRVLSPLDPNALRDFSVKTHDVVLYGKIVKLRQDLERVLLRLAAGKPDLNNRTSMYALAQRLVEKGLLPAEMAGEVNDILPMLNRTIHGDWLARDSAERALAVGNLLLNELEKLSPMEV
jgi:histidyl-tRNA synthetase